MAHPFRFGIINEQMRTRADWQQKARLAEELGYATFLLRDHLVPDFFGDQFAPLVALMAAADATEQLRVGTLVLNNDLRHPAMLAKEASTLDVLSNGRFECGLGAGWLQSEYQQSGLTFDKNGVRVQRLAEAIAVLKGIWAGAPFDFDGQQYHLHGLQGFPVPFQRPHPPLLIGAGKEQMLRLAGREANIVSILNSSVSSGTMISYAQEKLPAAVAQKIAWIREGAGERFDAIELNMLPTVIITDQRRSATEAYIQEQGWEELAVEAVWEMPSVFIGTVEQIAADMIQRRDTYGLSYYVVPDAEMQQFAPVVARLRGE